MYRVTRVASLPLPVPFPLTLSLFSNIPHNKVLLKACGQCLLLFLTPVGGFIFSSMCLV